MAGFFDKIRELEEGRRKIAAGVMSAIAMIIVILVWITYASMVMGPAKSGEGAGAGIAASLARTTLSFPQTLGSWASSVARYFFGQREVVIEK